MIITVQISGLELIFYEWMSTSYNFPEEPIIFKKNFFQYFQYFEKL